MRDWLFILPRVFPPGKGPKTIRSSSRFKPLLLGLGYGPQQQLEDVAVRF
jgi:hypothetical protein